MTGLMTTLLCLMHADLHVLFAALSLTEPGDWIFIAGLVREILIEELEELSDDVLRIILG